MPLTWDLTRCADDQKLISEHEWGVTNTLILMTMSIGMGEITEANAAEVYARLRFLDKLYGPPMYGKDSETGEVKHVSFTPEMVRDRIGMRCNVSFETQLSFMKRHLKWFMREGVEEYHKAFRPVVEDDAS
jgi:hypothetical protein